MPLQRKFSCLLNHACGDLNQATERIIQEEVFGDAAEAEERDQTPPKALQMIGSPAKDEAWLEARDIYRVHVSLRELNPPVWRRIELPSQATLKQFHRILQIAMGWENQHLHEYVVGGQRYGVPDPAYNDPGEVVAEAGVRLAAVLPELGAEILYLYTGNPLGPLRPPRKVS